MCRSIKRLRNPGRPSSEEEIRAAALQFVRKVSGFHRPSSANEKAFTQGIDEIAKATERLLNRLPVIREVREPAPDLSSPSDPSPRP